MKFGLTAFSLALAIGTLTLPATLHPAKAAAVLDATAPIEAVTVYAGSARIERALTINLPAGSATIRIAGLTSKLDPSSLRVESGAAWLRIAAVDARRTFSTVASREEVRRLEDRIRALEAERASLNDVIAAADRQLDLVKALISREPGSGNGEAGPARSAAHWREMLALVGEGSAKAYARQRKARQALREVEARLRKTQRELAQLQGDGKEAYQVDLAVDSGQEAIATLTLVYQVSGASWRPMYDARLDSTAGTLDLDHLAEVSQSTGEDWQDVALTLSTSRPGTGAGLPEVDTWFLHLQQPRPKSAQRRELMLDEALAPAAEPALGKGAGEQEKKRQNVAIVAGEFAAEYRVPGRVAITPDGAAKKVRLTTRAFDVDLAVKAAPKFVRAAYLVGTLDYEGEAPLLPGVMSIYRDGAFVGRTGFEMIRPGETREVSFGVDDRVAIDYRLAEGERGTGGIISKESRERRVYAIEVANHHGRAMRITVLDQLPVAAHEDIDVDLLAEATPPSERDVDGRKGVMAWAWTYEPGETRTITFGYEVSYPDGARVPGF